MDEHDGISCSRATAFSIANNNPGGVAATLGLESKGTSMALLTDKTALVTGASRGIGRATAHALADAGARVIVHYGRSALEADALDSEIRGLAASPMPRRQTYPRRKAPLRLQPRFARSSDNISTSSFRMPAFLRPPRSRITPSQTSTTFSPQMCDLPFFSLKNCCRS